VRLRLGCYRVGEIPFGRYRLLEQLGYGIGQVWGTYDAEIDRVAAIKILCCRTSRPTGRSSRGSAAKPALPHASMIPHRADP
jgi:hypothetical protein